MWTDRNLEIPSAETEANIGAASADIGAANANDLNGEEADNDDAAGKAQLNKRK